MSSWSQRADWSAGRIQCRPSLFLAVFNWLFAVALSALPLIIIIVILPQLEWPGQMWVPLGLLAFSAAGATLMRDAIHRTRNWKHGGADFVMTAVPGVIGGRLEGIIRAHSELATLGEIEVVLSCKAWRGGTRSAPGKGETVWSDQQRMRPSIEDRDSVAIPVSFQVPVELPESDSVDQARRARITWLLQARPALAGVVLSFEVPVFKT